VLEDIADNLFNPDPYFQQGGDMVRVGGLQYTCDPAAKVGSRISNMMLKGASIDASKKYKVAGWAPVAEGGGPGNTGEAAWDMLSAYLRDKKTIKPPKLNLPTLTGAKGNAGIA
jgi:S-sulfosulfanyl-L-cysteine sulfohydrolase